MGCMAYENDHMGKASTWRGRIRLTLPKRANKMATELTNKAKENLRRNEDSRKKDSKYVKLDPGEKRTLHFNAEKMEPLEAEFDGKKSTRYQYTVTEPNDPDQQEKYFTVSKRTSAIIDTYLSEGKTILNVYRIGAGKDTQYVITPA